MGLTGAQASFIRMQTPVHISSKQPEGHPGDLCQAPGDPWMVLGLPLSPEKDFLIVGHPTLLPMDQSH